MQADAGKSCLQLQLPGFVPSEIPAALVRVLNPSLWTQNLQCEQSTLSRLVLKLLLKMRNEGSCFSFWSEVLQFDRLIRYAHVCLFLCLLHL